MVGDNKMLLAFGRFGSCPLRRSETEMKWNCIITSLTADEPDDLFAQPR